MAGRKSLGKMSPCWLVVGIGGKGVDGAIIVEGVASSSSLLSSLFPLLMKSGISANSSSGNGCVSGSNTLAAEQSSVKILGL